MKNEDEAVAMPDAYLFRLAFNSLAPRRKDADYPKPPKGEKVRARKVKKVRALRDTYIRKEAAVLDWLNIAKLAAGDLQAFAFEIFIAANANQKKFFIDLGKCLSGEMKSGYDNLDISAALILSHNPVIKAKDAIHELKERGHTEITEENFRMRKHRLKALGRVLDKRQNARALAAAEFTSGTLALDEKEDKA